ncbi:IS91 family transposase [Clostridium sp. Marseille-P299]|uniref:IS91 family transposase n=1 Tax=Clostridium sp. Marseille-P299 TaxID=1805477 RepID=UPI00082A91DE|nr:transposase [Clostridium sp. Marseille-P299]
MFSKVNKTEHFVPGFICVLHTFGRSLQWNPHIHCLISESATGNITLWRPFKHYNYLQLRNAFRTALLNEMETVIEPSFKKMKSYIYKYCPNGFYVRAKPNKCDPNTAIKYIGRYLGRPVIATKRIDSYDGTNVTFHYNRHEDEKLIVETIPVLDFIARLIQHIPEKHFKMIRYYGIYARHRKEDSKLRRAISKEKQRIFLSFNRWRDSILASFGYDPLRCPNCSSSMLILELYHNKKRVPLDELYEKVMQNYKFHT